MNSLSSRTQYLVTTTAKKGRREGDSATRTEVWETSRPLSLGHPFRWVLENTSQGVRVRDLSIPFSEIQTDRPLTLTHEQIRKGEELPITDKFSIRLKPVAKASPVFGTERGQQISVFSCMGNWVMGSQELGTQFVGKTGDTTRFVITKSTGAAGGQDQYRIRTMSPGVLIAGRELKEGLELPLTSSEIAVTVIQADNYSWRFAGVESQKFAPFAGGRRATELDTIQFRKALLGATGALALLIVLSIVWPKPEPKEEELIPAQFAKIVLAQPKKPAAAAAGNAAPADNAKRAEDAKVVQAFRAQALQSSVSKLLKGGMSRLLNQSDFVAGVNPNQEAARLFNQKSDALSAATPDAGLTGKQDVAVGSIGGGGSSVGVKVGYGKGERAAISGQGSGHVAMDLGNASVEEGLTKDEVGAVIHSHLAEVRYCYEAAMLRNPEVQGKLLMNFVIGPVGKVRTAEVKSSTLEDPRLDDCILRRLLTWKFPNTKGGIDVAVTYPFIFKTLGR